MTAARANALPLPEVHEPRVVRCGHHVTEEITEPEALALSHLVTDLNAIEVAAAVNALPERRGTARERARAVLPEPEPEPAGQRPHRPAPH
ncbi:hypothetical protein ACWDD9_31240 [Kitasatospora sp. NPDC001119]